MLPDSGGSTTVNSINANGFVNRLSHIGAVYYTQVCVNVYILFPGKAF